MSNLDIYITHDWKPRPMGSDECRVCGAYQNLENELDVCVKAVYERGLSAGRAEVLRQVAKLPSPFQPSAFRDPEGVWWNCDWCHFTDLVWSKDKHVAPSHPDNGCLWPQAQAVTRDRQGA